MASVSEIANKIDAGDTINVMVVDDSAVVRGLITRMLEADPGVSVVSSVANGEMAIKNISRYEIDVVVLDVEMPVMDGLTALPKLLEIKPSVVVIMASTLTKKNAEISIRALESGASDYVPKPTASKELTASTSEFQRDLTEKVTTLGEIARRKRTGGRPAPRRAAQARQTAAPQPAPSGPSAPFALRPAPRLRPEILAIGSSTGGPQALFELLKGVKPSIKAPVVIAQHMPPTFTTILAEHITRMTGWPCREARDGDVLTPGEALLAPGDYHMIVEGEGLKKVARLNQSAPENYCRPAVDPMLRSLAAAYGDRTLAVILTGMGVDGKNGGDALIGAGGSIIAQDEDSSVVWGMPGAVAMAGLCSLVSPIRDLASYINNQMGRGA